jgi:hypothetical protein
MYVPRLIVGLSAKRDRSVVIAACDRASIPALDDELEKAAAGLATFLAVERSATRNSASMSSNSLLSCCLLFLCFGILPADDRAVKG